MAYSRAKGYTPDYPTYKSHGGENKSRLRCCLWCQKQIVSLSPFGDRDTGLDTFFELELHVMEEHIPNPYQWLDDEDKRYTLEDESCQSESALSVAMFGSHG